MATRKDIMYQHMIAFQGTDVLFNDDTETTKVLIVECEDSNTDEIDLKNIISDQSLQNGDYFTIDDSTYMIIDTKQVTNSSYTLGTFRKAIKITMELNLKEIYAVVDKVKGVYSDGQEITEVHDEYTFIVSKESCNYTSLSVGRNLIVYAGGSYDAISIDDSKDGILIITGRFNSIYIAHTYTISLNSTSQSIQETASYTIVATCTDDGTTQTNPTIEYTSSDESIATISDSGVITALKAGSCNITCTYNGVSNIFALTVTAKTSEKVISYTYNFSQSITALKQYMATTLTTTKTINGVADSSLYIDYSFDSNTDRLISSGNIVITRRSDSSINIRNMSVTSNTTIYLTVTDKSTGTKILDNQAIILTGM